MILTKGMEYKLSDEADKYLEKKKKKDNKLYKRLLKKIDAITKDPYSFEYLSSNGKWRKARTGDYRILFSVSYKLDENDNPKLDEPYCYILLIDKRAKSYKIFNRKFKN